MAYAALLSLKHTILRLWNFSRISVASSTREILQSAIDHGKSLERTLGRCSEGVRDLEERIIIEAASKLEDAIEFPISADGCSPTFSFNLDQLTQDVHCFSKMAKKMEQNLEELWEQKARKMVEEYIEELFVQKTEKEEEGSPTHMVGLSDQFLQIRDNLNARESDTPVIWISGMAGIGKTTLAKAIYNDSCVKENFECRAFVRVGREYRLKQILQAIAAQLNLDFEEMIMEVAQLNLDDEEIFMERAHEDLYGCFCRILTVRKCLIVFDDVWEYTFVSSLFRTRQKIEDLESRILVTSRSNAPPRFQVYGIQMRFLNEEESWEVLRRKVFGGEEECPKELVKAGKKIANNCGGLPLLIISVANQLHSKVQKNPECWNEVAEKPNSVFEDASHQISELLLSSYHPLSEQDKLRFLYFVAFPLNYTVWYSSVANLWCVEGFISDWEIPHTDVLDVLLRKNLVMGYQKSLYSGSTKACRLHCAYWYVSKRVAKDNKFLFIINSYADGLDECVENHRRFAIHNNVLLAIKEVHNEITSISTVRSLLCMAPYHQYQVPICMEWKMLRVLNALTIRFYEFPAEVVELILLRYLALTCNENLPRSISKLWNLQFLIVHQHLSIKGIADESYVPVEIWDMQELIHLQIMGRNLPDPPPGVALPKLRKLLDVGVESCTKGVLQSIPNLHKLKIQIDLAPDATETLSFFPHISYLSSFKSVIMNHTLLLRPPPPLSISTSGLMKLSLSGFGYPWEDMSKIAELTHLQILKLYCYAFQGVKWDAKEMRFPSLQYLVIEDTDLEQWTAGDETFPWLSRLIMKNCYEFEQIPQISRTSSIELVDCNPLAETCVKQRYDTERVIFSVNYSWKDEKLKS